MAYKRQIKFSNPESKSISKNREILHDMHDAGTANCNNKDNFTVLLNLISKPTIVFS